MKNLEKKEHEFLDLEGAQRKFRELLLGKRLTCLRCERSEDVELVPSQTAYPWDGSGKDPNAPFPLCPLCANEYRQLMDDLWSEYRSGQL